MSEWPCKGYRCYEDQSGFRWRFVPSVRGDKCGEVSIRGAPWQRAPLPERKTLWEALVKAPRVYRGFRRVV